jgi:hypothetical protein
MKIVCVGGGPEGPSFVTVIESDPPWETYGSGAVYRDDLLDTHCRNDRESAEIQSERLCKGQ